MSQEPRTTDVRELWDRVAEEWAIQVGDDGDANRRLNSDPVLWELVGDVSNRFVLDAGCGVGYLSRKLQEKGASVTGVDLSPKMIEIARRRYPDINFYVDSCSELASLTNNTFDLLVANYVLMDVEDLNGAMQAFRRVLKINGFAVLVFSHPCFPQSSATVDKESGAVTYSWGFNYFEESRRVDPPWAPFTTDFIWFHRPLSTYWKAFSTAGFAVIDLREPRIMPERYHLAADARRLRNSQTRPYSIALKLQKMEIHQ